MITISVQHEVDRLARRLKSFTEQKQLRYAVARALTKTAQDVQAETRRNMPQRFTLRRQWVVQGIRVVPATKENLTAIVYSRDKFMDRQEKGGTKNPLGNYIAIPTKLVRRTPTQMIRKSDRPASLGNKAEIVEVNGRKFLALKRSRKGRNDNQLRLLYLLVPRAEVKERLKMGQDAERVIPSVFQMNLYKAFADAMSTAR